MKKLLPWSDYSLKQFRLLYKKEPKLRATLDAIKRSGILTPEIPKACYDSQKRAMAKLTMQALGIKCRPGGDSTFGDIAVDAEQCLLSEVEASGTVRGTYFLPFVRSLGETGSPYKDDARLDRFLIKVGRKLENKSKRRNLPDWHYGVDQTMQYIVHGWCVRILVDGEKWPPLCCLSTPVLKGFLRLAKGVRTAKEARTIEQEIRRLGLKRISKGRVMRVEKRFGVFRFG